MIRVLADGFASGHAIDAILGLVALEFAAFSAWHYRTGRGPAPAALAPNLASGALLLLAVRASLVGAGWPLVAAPITASLLTHVLDMRARLK